LVDNWIRHIKDVYRIYEDELKSMEDETERFHKFVEFNVYEQVFDLLKTSIIQNACENRNEPKIHGWVYSIKIRTNQRFGNNF
jgi:carbonic anhydrase